MASKIFYVTKEKLKELKKEYEDLVDFERRKVMSEEAPKILESEDVNPEFISFQEDINFLRSRIEELKNILENHQLIKNPPKEKQAFVDIGAKVKVKMAGRENEFVIVGTLEAEPKLGRISNESPIGQALLGKRVGDEFIIDLPRRKTCKVKSIKYEIS